MPVHVETDVSVQRFAFTQDEGGRRLTFPRAETKRVEGRAGSVTYGAEECAFDNLVGRLDRLRWTADRSSLGGAWLRDDNGRFDISVSRLDLPDNVMLTRAEQGIEIVTPTATLTDMKLSIRGPFGRSGERPAPPPEEPRELRQDKLRFLDSLSGRIYVTIKVVLDLPVIGKRTLDQKLKVPIQEGRLNFRALEESLDWLEGTFLDIEHQRDTLALQWKVPIVGSARDLVRWQLDQEAASNAALGYVPVRALADFRAARPKNGDKPAGRDGGGILKSLSLEGLDLALSLLAPRSLEVGGGLVLFGGDDQPGMVDLKVTGGITDRGPGTLKGAIGSVDTTIKDLRLGPVVVTADRLHFDSLDQLVVTFEAFRPVKIDVLVRRVTATNLALQVGGRVEVSPG